MDCDFAAAIREELDPATRIDHALDRRSPGLISPIPIERRGYPARVPGFPVGELC